MTTFQEANREKQLQALHILTYAKNHLLHAGKVLDTTQLGQGVKPYNTLRATQVNLKLLISQVEQALQQEGENES
jgi:hypothetical protein